MAEQTLNPKHNLKDVREAKGLTLEIVHEATKIPMDALKAIEQGYSVRILTPFYFRGFVKIYAEFLGLDVQEVFKAYNLEKKPTPVIQSSLEQEEERKSKPKAESKPRPAPIQKEARPKAPKKLLLSPEIINRGQSFVAGVWTPKNRSLIFKVLIAAVLIFAVVKAAGAVGSYFKNKPKAKTTKTAVQTPKPKAAVKPKAARKENPAPPPAAEQTPPPAAAAAAPAAQADTVAAAAAPAPVPQKVQLVARALKNSWIQVKVDGEVVFGMTMQKGTMETWTADDSIEVSGRNISELEMEVNGKSMGRLGSTHRSARKVLITKDGLSVKK